MFGRSRIGAYRLSTLRSCTQELKWILTASWQILSVKSSGWLGHIRIRLSRPFRVLSQISANINSFEPSLSLTCLLPKVTKPRVIERARNSPANPRYDGFQYQVLLNPERS